MTPSLAVEEIKSLIEANIKTVSRKTIDKASPNDMSLALGYTIRDLIVDKWIQNHEQYALKDPKIVYYMSMEFLTGRFLGNNLLNLGVYDTFKKALEALDIDLNLLEEQEPDPGLGNGGLGRLAACFLDSLSTLSYPAYGCGILYHYGIFKQEIENGYQVEKPDSWLAGGNPWGVRRREYAMEVKFGGSVRAVETKPGKYKFIQENYNSVLAIPYDYPIVGYKNNTVNTLRLWDAEAKEEFDLKSFNEGNYQKAAEAQNLATTLTRVLYPADEFVAGKELRLRQQYFFISATIQQVLKRFHAMHDDEFSLLPDLVQFQMNDTHPSMTVAELMRVLMDDYALDWDDAWEITQKTCAYTNHTIMSEALEKWPVELFSRLLPRIFQVIEEINRRFCKNLIEFYGNDADKIRKMAIIADGQIRMAYLAIVGSHSVNGVAAIHTEILKNKELKDFYDIYPKRFNNKTNGITQRRWLLHANPALSALITDHIGSGWITQLDELKKLEPLVKDSKFCRDFMEIKLQNKKMLAQYIEATKGIEINPDSIFDIQVKRLHEYKRQLLNVLHILYLYNRVKNDPSFKILPRTFIFGAKAAASYQRAKLIIKLINSVADVVNNDPAVKGLIKVVFMENYNVSLAEKLIPAADVSEQISTAGKEASGTGNMKFMLNGAITIGTLDGANVEILEEVGEDNIFIFGHTAEEIMAMAEQNSYDPWSVYNMDSDIQLVTTSLINGTISKDNPELFRELYTALLDGYHGARADEYFILKDFHAYKVAQQKVNDAYGDKALWVKMAILNVANAGKFSSDRTIEQYAKEIWGLKKLTH